MIERVDQEYDSFYNEFFWRLETETKTQLHTLAQTIVQKTKNSLNHVFLIKVDETVRLTQPLRFLWFLPKKDPKRAAWKKIISAERAKYWRQKKNEYLQMICSENEEFIKSLEKGIVDKLKKANLISGDSPWLIEMIKKVIEFYDPAGAQQHHGHAQLVAKIEQIIREEEQALKKAAIEKENQRKLEEFKTKIEVLLKGTWGDHSWASRKNQIDVAMMNVWDDYMSSLLDLKSTQKSWDTVEAETKNFLQTQATLRDGANWKTVSSLVACAIKESLDKKSNDQLQLFEKETWHIADDPKGQKVSAQEIDYPSLWLIKSWDIIPMVKRIIADTEHNKERYGLGGNWWKEILNQIAKFAEEPILQNLYDTLKDGRYKDFLTKEKNKMSPQLNQDKDVAPGFADQLLTFLETYTKTANKKVIVKRPVDVSRPPPENPPTTVDSWEYPHISSYQDSLDKAKNAEAWLAKENLWWYNQGDTLLKDMKVWDIVIIEGEGKKMYITRIDSWREEVIVLAYEGGRPGLFVDSIHSIVLNQNSTIWRPTTYKLRKPETSSNSNDASVVVPQPISGAHVSAATGKVNAINHIFEYPQYGRPTIKSLEEGHLAVYFPETSMQGIWAEDPGSDTSPFVLKLQDDETFSLDSSKPEETLVAIKENFVFRKKVGLLEVEWDIANAQGFEVISEGNLERDYDNNHFYKFWVQSPIRIKVVAHLGPQGDVKKAEKDQEETDDMPVSDIQKHETSPLTEADQKNIEWLIVSLDQQEDVEYLKSKDIDYTQRITERYKEMTDSQDITNEDTLEFLKNRIADTLKFKTMDYVLESQPDDRERYEISKIYTYIDKYQDNSTKESLSKILPIYFKYGPSRLKQDLILDIKSGAADDSITAKLNALAEVDAEWLSWFEKMIPQLISLWAEKSLIRDRITLAQKNLKSHILVDSEEKDVCTLLVMWYLFDADLLLLAHADFTWGVGVNDQWGYEKNVWEKVKSQWPSLEKRKGLRYHYQQTHILSAQEDYEPLLKGITSREEYQTVCRLIEEYQEINNIQKRVSKWDFRATSVVSIQELEGAIDKGISMILSKEVNNKSSKYRIEQQKQEAAPDLKMIPRNSLVRKFPVLTNAKIENRKNLKMHKMLPQQANVGNCLEVATADAVSILPIRRQLNMFSIFKLEGKEDSYLVVLPQVNNKNKAVAIEVTKQEAFWYNKSKTMEKDLRPISANLSTQLIDIALHKYVFPDDDVNRENRWISKYQRKSISFNTRKERLKQANEIFWILNTFETDRDIITVGISQDLPYRFTLDGVCNEWEETPFIFYSHHAYFVKGVDKNKKTVTIGNPHNPYSSITTLTYVQFIQLFRNMEISDANDFIQTESSIEAAIKKRMDKQNSQKNQMNSEIVPPIKAAA
jgi:hypothetical protein